MNHKTDKRTGKDEMANGIAINTTRIYTSFSASCKSSYNAIQPKRFEDSSTASMVQCVNKEQGCSSPDRPQIQGPKPPELRYRTNPNLAHSP